MGTLSFKNGKFYFAAYNAEDRQLAHQAQFLQDADSLRWVTRNAAKAVKLRRFADASAERKFKNTFITEIAPPECIQYPDDKIPYSWQMRSAWHCLTRTPAYCADEAGLGKTITAALCLNSSPGRALIICPAFLKYNWQKEITQWCSLLGIQVVEKREESLSSARVIILPDSLVADHQIWERMKDQKFEWLFIDEAHRYKSKDAQRTKALVGDENENGYVDLARRTVFLSGTPIPNGRPIELFHLLHGVAAESIGFRSEVSFGETFCGAKLLTRFQGRSAIVHRDFSGASNLPQLGRELRSKLLIRHEKQDVLTELGPKTRRLVFLDQPKRFQKLEEKILHNKSLQELMGEDHELGDLARYRREIGEAKTLPAVRYCEDILIESSDKLVVFAHHIAVVEELCAKLSRFNPLMIRGGMTSKQKDNRVAEFQNNPKVKVIIGNIDSMGVGNTLTKAPRVVMAEYSFVPGINEQAEDRIHRLTQEKNVYIDYLVYRNSLDERMLRSALAKQKNINRILKG